ncbi:hypothetical protein [Cohnella sp. OV330]|uniref:hypothetical protein n=1 Tax=Cohnella sp. OV330 TaxID=1855288 RepID=UPI001314C20F|nr:hypothetical protein [Cohnella sp. OV330]
MAKRQFIPSRIRRMCKIVAKKHLMASRRGEAHAFAGISGLLTLIGSAKALGTKLAAF